MTTTNLSESQEDYLHDENCTCDRCEERDKACLDAWVKAQEAWRRKREHKQRMIDHANNVKECPSCKFYADARIALINGKCPRCQAIV